MKPISLRRLGATRIGVWVIKHLVSPLDRWFYRCTNGRWLTLGHPLAPTLLLTTIWRKSGQPRTTPVFYLRAGDRVIVCNVNPGFERPNPWTLNLRANPTVQAQIGAQTQHYRSREATSSEVAHYWPQLVALWPAYQHHFEKSGQRSLFVLEPKR
jgi:deazaflavin-dependent oxidoreductase (nitroreductase family)